ncbi:MAG: hypothetical protein ACK5AZ_25250, partial [Bryobacteraceae bacterium]
PTRSETPSVFGCGYAALCLIFGRSPEPAIRQIPTLPTQYMVAKRAFEAHMHVQFANPNRLIEGYGRAAGHPTPWPGDPVPPPIRAQALEYLNGPR